MQHAVKHELIVKINLLLKITYFMNITVGCRVLVVNCHCPHVTHLQCLEIRYCFAVLV